MGDQNRMLKRTNRMWRVTEKTHPSKKKMEKDGGQLKTLCVRESGQQPSFKLLFKMWLKSDG